MPIPDREQLLNPLLEVFHSADRTLSISEQVSSVAIILGLSQEELSEKHRNNRTKLDYQLAWARNYLKRLGLLTNVERGIWSLTLEGRSQKSVSAEAIRGLHIKGEIESDGTGVELENIEDIENPILKPFDPTLIRVESKPATLGQLISRIEHDEIDLAPAFQRKAGIWTTAAQSRLIESILIRIPIPAFYFDASNEDKWLVVDGLQRLTALKRFAIDNTLRLQGVEFLDTMENKTFSQIPRSLQRRLHETGVTIFLIEKNTPSNVKFNIFKRINTGGLPLSTQEIRHALNQGPVTDFLKDLASCMEFKVATNNSIRDDRMADRECVLRFLAFTISSPIDYRATDLDGFLSDTMVELNKFRHPALLSLRRSFIQAMMAANFIFERDAFRKPLRLFGRRMPINKALFETWAVNLGQLSQDQIRLAIEKRALIVNGFEALCTQSIFVNSISQGTGDPFKVRQRFSSIAKLISDVIK